MPKNLTKTIVNINAYETQEKFILDKSFSSVFCGGVGAGKSYAGAIKTMAYCAENPGSWGMVTAPQNRILEIATIPTYEKVFPPEFIKKKRLRPHPEWELQNGCKIFFWSTEKPETISGSQLAFAHMDEGSKSPYMAYSNIKKRLRQRTVSDKPYPHQIWVTTTPKQLNWLYREVTQNKDPMTLFTASTADNRFLGNEEERRKYIENLGLTGKDYEQEIEGKFVLLAGDTLVSSGILEQRQNDCLEPLEVRDNGTTLIWKYPVVGVNYIAGADCADEGGGGVNDLIIIDPQTGEEVAEINADIPADEFAFKANQLCSEYFYPLLAPERNGTVGGIVTTKLQDMGYPNLYRDRLGKIGWYTTSFAMPPKVSRFTMLKEYEEAIRLRRTIIRSYDTLDELSTFIRTGNDSYKPREGYRSDRIMARAICWQMRKERTRPISMLTAVHRTAGTYNR